MNRNLHIAMTALMLWAGAAMCLAADKPADKPSDDLTSDGGIKVMSWRPVIWSLYVRAMSGGAGDQDLGGLGAKDRAKLGQETPKPKENIPSDVAAWAWLEPQIAIRRRAADAKTDYDQRHAAKVKELDDARARRDASKDSTDEQQKLIVAIKQLEAELADMEKRKADGSAIGYGPKDFVPSGWRRTSDDKAAVPVVELWGDDGEKSKVQCIDRNKPVFIFWEPDILITAEESEKAATLEKNFSVISLAITVHPVPKEPGDSNNDPASRTRVRNPAVIPNPDDPATMQKMLVTDKERTYAWKQLGFVRLFPELVGEWRPQRFNLPNEAGLWEVRMTAVIKGRLSETAEYETKTVEGAIRFALVDPGSIDIGVLDRDGKRQGPTDVPKKP